MRRGRLTIDEQLEIAGILVALLCASAAIVLAEWMIAWMRRL